MVPAGWGTGRADDAARAERDRTQVPLPRPAQAVGAARRVLREWERHFDPVLFYDLSLCVSELVTNRVQTRRAADSEEIELAVRRSSSSCGPRSASPLQDMVL